MAKITYGEPAAYFTKSMWEKLEGDNKKTTKKTSNKKINKKTSKKEKK